MPNTKATPIRLTVEDKAKLAQIRERMGLPSMASAIRYAINVTKIEIDLQAGNSRKKSRKSQNGA